MGAPLIQAEGVALKDALVNGDFEEAMELTVPAKGETSKVVSAAGWTSLIGKLPEVVTWGSDPKETPKRGGRFLRLKDDSASEPIAVESTRQPAQPGAEYGASIWVRTLDKGDPALYLNFYNAAGKRLNFKVGQAVKSGPYPEWTYLRAQLKAPKGTATVSIVLYSYPKDVGNYDFDDAVMGQVGVNGMPSAAPGTVPAPVEEKPKKEEDQATVLNWQGKSSDPTAGVAAPSHKNASEPKPVPVPTAEAATAAQADAAATAKAIVDGEEPPKARIVSEEEKRALGIEPLPPREPDASGMRATPKPNKELPPPWILPTEAEPKP